MNKPFSREPMMEMFIFETVQLIEQLEQAILNSEKANCMEVSSINEIFRIMHTIKGSAAMMMLNNIASLTHSIEDLFYFFRENESIEMDNSKVCDIVLGSIDFIKEEVVKLENEQDVDGEPAQLIAGINEYLCLLKGSDFVLASESLASQQSNQPSNQKFYISADRTDLMPNADSCKFRAVIFFEHGCEMENIRAFNIVHQLKDLAESIDYFPEDIIENDTSIDYIRKNGFEIIGSAFGKWEQIEGFFAKTPFAREIELNQIEQDAQLIAQTKPAKQIFLEDFNEELQINPIKKNLDEGPNLHSTRQSLISVNVNKLDKLMDLVGELVISEAMVTLNPDLANGLNLDNFSKAARQHRKIINELQDIVMSIRMVPLTITFQKMNRIVRDMSKKLNKEVLLEIIGEETEVDKNIIEHLSDPLMHLIRNAIDHGIESREERIAHGKSIAGKIKLEAKNEGGDVWITVKDDGAGLSKEKILSRARTNGLISKPDNELTDREIYSTILLPGFSTREEVSEFSGRGVGMDVVSNNIEMVGGTLLVDSIEGVETTISLKIPLTLAIIDGMGVEVGSLIYIVPTRSIKESFRAREQEIIHDPDGNEMVMVRGECYPIMRLHERYRISTDVKEIQDGIIVIVENDSKHLCLFADGLLGEQQVVVKSLPKYLKKISGISGCTLLGNGKASLILDVAALINNQ